MKRHIRTSYNIENVDSFPNIDNKNGKTSPKIKHITSNQTTTTVSLSDEESTIVSYFSQINILIPFK